jgi:hypothetical protein
MQRPFARRRIFSRQARGEDLLATCCRSITRRSLSASAIRGDISSLRISQERRNPLTRDAELLGDLLHRHALAIERQRLGPADPGTDLIQHLRRLGNQTDAEIPLRRLDYLAIGPPSRALTADLRDPALDLRHPPRVGIQRLLQLAQGPVEWVTAGHPEPQISKDHCGNGYVRNAYYRNGYYGKGYCAMLSAGKQRYRPRSPRHGGEPNGLQGQ